MNEQEETKAIERLQNLGNPIDYEKPTPSPGELLCNGCWKVSGDDKTGWTFYGFKHLAGQNLCEECSYKYGHDLQFKQRMGL